MQHPSGSGTSPQTGLPTHVGISGSARVFTDAGVTTAAFERLYAEQFERIVSSLQRKMPDWHEAEDLAQEIFISVGLAMVAGRVANPVAYLWKAAKYRLANWYRDRHEVVLYGTDPVPVVDPRDPKPGETMSPRVRGSMTSAAMRAKRAEERKQDLLRGIRELSTGQKRAYVLTDVYGFTETETASLLKVGRSTVSTQRTRAQIALRDELRLANSC